MTLLNKDAILTADDRQWEDVEVPEWGGTVRVLGLSGTERNAYQSSLIVIGSNGKPQRVNLEDQLAKLASRTLVGEDFERLFTDKEVKSLGRKNGRVLERIAKVAQRLSGLSEDAVEQAAGNSEAAQSGASTSA